MTRLVLIDGNAILHRAFHALPPLTTPDGKPVNAVYGFATMLIRLIHDLNPTHMIVCFDRKAPTFRKELYEKYQAHRPKMDDQLVPQVETVHELVRSFDIPILEKDGYEADDIIGTVTNTVTSNASNTQRAKKEQGKIDQVIIVTGDRDILQLVVDEKVFVYMPTKGLSEAKLYGEKETKERIGVMPEQIPDFKALAGDSSDNYPGVEGIGPKTAIAILEKTKTIDHLYKLLGKHNDIGLPDTVVARLLSKKDDALLSHELATIKTDVPVKITLSPIPPVPTGKSIMFFESLGFQSLVKRLEKKDEPKKKESNKKNDTKDDPSGKDQLSLI